MTPYFWLNQNEFPPIDGYEPTLNSKFPPYQYSFTLGSANVDVRANHAQSIRDLVAACTVLLKNTNNTLPLIAPGTIGVFGNDAGDLVDGLYFLGAPFAQQQGYGKKSAFMSASSCHANCTIQSMGPFQSLVAAEPAVSLTSSPH